MEGKKVVEGCRSSPRRVSKLNIKPIRAGAQNKVGKVATSSPSTAPTTKSGWKGAVGTKGRKGEAVGKMTDCPYLMLMILSTPCSLK